MLDAEAISWIGSCDWDGGGGLGDENRSQKNQTDIIDFFSYVFHQTISSHRNCRILEFAILFLRPTFLRIYPSQSQDPWFRDIASSSKSFDNF